MRNRKKEQKLACCLCRASRPGPQNMGVVGKCIPAQLAIFRFPQICPAATETSVNKQFFKVCYSRFQPASSSGMPSFRLQLWWYAEVTTMFLLRRQPLPHFYITTALQSHKTRSR